MCCCCCRLCVRKRERCTPWSFVYLFSFGPRLEEKQLLLVLLACCYSVHFLLFLFLWMDEQTDRLNYFGSSHLASERTSSVTVTLARAITGSCALDTHFLLETCTFPRFIFSFSSLIVKKNIKRLGQQVKNFSST